MRLRDLEMRTIKSTAPGPVKNPLKVLKNTVVYSSDLTKVYIVTEDGYFAGDDFDVTLTANSNLVIIPNSVLDFQDKKLYCSAFPDGVLITSKTANYREFTIATNSTIGGTQSANLCRHNIIDVKAVQSSVVTPVVSDERKIRKSIDTTPYTTPVAVKSGDIFSNTLGSELYAIQEDGFFGGDNFTVLYTVGSNLVTIPNNVLNWTGLKLYSKAFPAGVAITGKTANFREYTIASNSTVTGSLASNFCKLATIPSIANTGDIYFKVRGTEDDGDTSTVIPYTNPIPVKAGDMFQSSDKSEFYVVDKDGNYGGDQFPVTYTAGSNLVIIPNNVLAWSGLKLFSQQFPLGVAITSKTANYREYTIASNATLTSVERSNFCGIKAIRTNPNGEDAVWTDLSYSAGFTLADSTPLRARVKDGQLFVTGVVGLTTVGNITTLPTSLRPKYTMRHLCPTDTGIGEVSIATTGVVNYTIQRVGSGATKLFLNIRMPIN